MSVITKVHTFVDNIVADASEVNRNFDDIYAEFNGNINSANILSSYSPAASQITLNDTAGYYTAITVEQAVKDNIIPRGYNSIHVLTQQSQGIILFPGMIEVNRQKCVLSSRLQITAVTHITGTWASADTVYALIVPAVTEITKSDVKIVNVTSLSASNGINNSQSKNGIYFSATARMITTIFHKDITGDNATQTIFNHEYLQNPDKAFYYKFAICEAVLHGFTEITASVSGKFHDVVVNYDFKTGRYAYALTGQAGDVCGTIMSMTCPYMYQYSASTVATPFIFNGMAYEQTSGGSNRWANIGDHCQAAVMTVAISETRPRIQYIVNSSTWSWKQLVQINVIPNKTVGSINIY